MLNRVCTVGLIGLNCSDLGKPVKKIQKKIFKTYFKDKPGIANKKRFFLATQKPESLKIFIFLSKNRNPWIFYSRTKSWNRQFFYILWNDLGQSMKNPISKPKNFLHLPEKPIFHPKDRFSAQRKLHPAKTISYKTFFYQQKNFSYIPKKSLIFHTEKCFIPV